VMTVSAYCLNQAPAPALRYLIVHELAHFLEGSHNKRFWNLVAQFVPDYKAQSKLMTAFHQRAVQQDEASSLNPSGEKHPLLLKEKKSRGLNSQKSSPKTPQKERPQKEPGFIQSLLWDWLKF
ncbi:MAG: M48 family metallopeptidase, partial [Cyanobacteria bacterium]|nr:M48 family metallopeptidase [Cyanobacteriota bacterium]